MLELLKKIVALVPVGHELYNAIAELLRELCARVAASEDSVRETREMVAARADQVSELVTRLALLESAEKIPQLATAIKDVRLDALEEQINRLATALEQDPNVKFVPVELGTPLEAAAAVASNDTGGPPAIAAPPSAPPVQCAFHPYAPMNGSQCLFPECTWSGIDSAA